MDSISRTAEDSPRDRVNCLTNGPCQIAVGGCDDISATNRGRTMFSKAQTSREHNPRRRGDTQHSPRWCEQRELYSYTVNCGDDELYCNWTLGQPIARTRCRPCEETRKHREEKRRMIDHEKKNRTRRERAREPIRYWSRSTHGCTTSDDRSRGSSSGGGGGQTSDVDRGGGWWAASAEGKTPPQKKARSRGHVAVSTCIRIQSNNNINILVDRQWCTVGDSEAAIATTLSSPRDFRFSRWHHLTPPSTARCRELRTTTTAAAAKPTRPIVIVIIYHFFSAAA